MAKRLTEMTTAAGWAAKIGPEDLDKILSKIPKNTDKRLLVGIETSDDAAVYKLDEDRALIQTLDFFTPVVDDPYIFGQIAAANALSDVYAMGGEPILAMNIVCFPACEDMEILGEILRGGYDKVKESGALLVGGHSVDDKEPKYGLSVTGIVHPDEVRANNKIREDELLILTKPLGTGIGNTALKAEILENEDYEEMVKVMVHLNKYAAQATKGFDVGGITDITGFGFLGHILEMAKGSNKSVEIYSENTPILKCAKEFAQMGILPQGMYKNKNHIGKEVSFSDSVEEYMRDIFFDPQTSGGLLISVKEEEAQKLCEKIIEKGGIEAKIIGRVMKKKESYIYVI